MLIVEVADASLRYDRDIKVLLYARASITEAWIVDLANERVEVFSQPTTDGYRMSRQFKRGERIASAALAPPGLLVDDILGDTPPRRSSG